MAIEKQRRAFISYSRTNKEFATKLTKGLRSEGFPVWFDQLDILPGSRWDDEVEKALRECSIFMVILTPASIASENVKDEIGYAIDHGKRILPVLLEDCTVPLRLRRFQYVDFTTKNFEEGFESAKELLGDLVDQASTPVVEKTPVVEDKLENSVETEREAKAEAERLARQKAEDERLAIVKVEAERKVKEEADRLAAQKAEAERLARQKAEDERLAIAKAEAERKAKEEADRLAAQKAEADRLAIAKVEAERKAKEEADRLTAQKAESERLARQKAEEERMAFVEADRKAKAEAQRLAKLKVEEEQRAREKQEFEKKHLQAEAQLPKPVPSAQSSKSGRESPGKKSRMPLVIGASIAVVMVFVGIAVVVAAANMFQGMIPNTGSQIESPPAETSIVVNTPTKVKKIVNTPTVRPSPTAGPQKFFTEEFGGDISNWTYFVSKNDTTADTSGVEPITDHDFLVLDLGKWLNVYVMYDSYTYTNVRLIARAENHGTNNNNINLICRYSDKGWYEVAIANNGLYWLYAVDAVKGGYVKLADGGSTKIKAGNEVNEYTFICNDSTLALQINGFEAKTYTDNQYDFRDGQVGVGASSFRDIPVKVEFDWVKISQP